MDSHKSAARDHDNAPRKPRRKAKRKKGGATLVILALLAVVLLGAGAVGVVLYLVKYAGTPVPGPSAAVGAGLAEKLGERFVGSWEGDSPARPSVKVHLEITRDRVTLRGVNVRTNEWGKPLVYSWRPVRAEGDTTLVIRREEVAGEKHDIEWSVGFASYDAMSVTSLRDGVLIANFRRVERK